MATGGIEINKTRKVNYHTNYDKEEKEITINSDITNSELKFIIQNNKKKLAGLPLTRISGKNKRYKKMLKKRYILDKLANDFVKNIIREVVVERCDGE